MHSAIESTFTSPLEGSLKGSPKGSLKRSPKGSLKGSHLPCLSPWTTPTQPCCLCAQTSGYSPWVFQLKYKLGLIPFHILYIMLHLSLLEVLLDFLRDANILNQTPPLSGDTAAMTLSGRVRDFFKSCAVWMYDKYKIQPLTTCTQSSSICASFRHTAVVFLCHVNWNGLPRYHKEG